MDDVTYRSKRLMQYGLRIGDQLELAPLQGRKRMIDLTRTEYLFTPSGEYQAAVMGTKVLLSSTVNQQFELKLYLEGEMESGRYILESLTNQPVLVNGVSLFKSYIERGDLIEIGHNRLRATPRSSQNSEEQLHTLNPSICASNLTVLIEGETGTGKSYLAKQIHAESGRRGNFVQLNIASFGEGVVESELFGHVRGAFTGALRAKEGAISEANYGTLFLDEIDSLSLELQSKLLLFLDSMEFRPVGGTGLRSVDIRLIVASGRKLEELVECGKMRKDFFYRISSGERVELKPLRQRPDFLRSLMITYLKQKSVECAPELISFYQKQAWPGNTRQFLGHLDKKIILGRRHYLVPDELDRQLIPSCEVEPQHNYSQIKNLEDVKVEYASYVFKRAQNNKKIAADLLGITVPTLRSLLDKVGVLTLDRLDSCVGI